MKLDEIVLDNVQDVYYVSVKDDGVVLGRHVKMPRRSSITFQTRCGTVTIGGDVMFDSIRTFIDIHWSYF